MRTQPWFRDPLCLSGVSCLEATPGVRSGGRSLNTASCTAPSLSSARLILILRVETAENDVLPSFWNFIFLGL